MRIALLALLSLACQVASNTAPEWTATPVECRISFDPQPELLSETEAAAARWSAATGCTFDIVKGGVVVAMVQRIDKPDGTQAPGITSDDLRQISIHARSNERQRPRVMMHEFCHVFGVGADHVDTGGVCGGTKDHTDLIDAASLADVCTHLPCPAFVPEG